MRSFSATYCTAPPTSGARKRRCVRICPIAAGRVPYEKMDRATSPSNGADSRRGGRGARPPAGKSTCATNCTWQRHDLRLRTTCIHGDAALRACSRGCRADAERPGAERKEPGGTSSICAQDRCAESLAPAACIPADILIFRRVMPLPQSLYTSFPNLVDIDGMPISLAQFKGNVSLVINVATY